MLPIAPMQAPHLPVAHPNDFRCLPPRNLLRHRSQNHFLNFHHPLHGGPRIVVHACLPACIFFPSRLYKADISCAIPTGHIMCYQHKTISAWTWAVSCGIWVRPHICKVRPSGPYGGTIMRYRTVVCMLFATIIVVSAFLAQSTIANDDVNPLTVDHYVSVHSVVPFMTGQTAQ